MVFFLPNKKRFGYKIGIQFNNTPLVAEQNNYASKIVNAYIVKMYINVRIFTVAMEYHLMGKVHGVLVMTL